MKQKNILKYFFAAFLFLILLSGCGGLPSDLKKACKAIPKKIESGKANIDKNYEFYLDFIKDGKLNKIKPAFNKENLENSFKLAHQELDRADVLYIKNLKVLLDQNKEELAEKITVELKKIILIIIDADTKSKYPLKRAKHIYDIFLKADSIYKDAISKSDSITKTVKDLETDLLVRTKKDFPEKISKINAKFAPLSLMENESKDALLSLKNEYNNHKNEKTTDYSILAKSVALLDSSSKKIQILKEQFSKDIDSLSKSYTKILKDMKSIHSVIVKRESWNNNQDFSTTESVNFIRIISPEVYEFVDTNNIEIIAELYPGWGNLKLKNHIGPIWQKLGIDPGAKWPRQQGHDSASFWFESWDTKYFHQYTIIEGGEQHDTTWQEISEDLYEDNFEYLGMAILTKPYGMFEDEADSEASPPGMGFVGNSEYGKWEKDNKGDSFWRWYGKYALFSNLLYYSTMGPMRYSTWNRYNTNYRGREPFFGSTPYGSAQYGTRGEYTKKSSKFQSTSFAKMGGFKKPVPSVRGASRAVNGGGPGSKGK